MGMIVLILRFVVRFRSVGIKGLQGDDLFAFIVAILYTVDAATVHIVCKYLVYLMLLDRDSQLILYASDYAGTNVEAASVQATRSTLSTIDETQNTKY